jgi:hypothetical protein
MSSSPQVEEGQAIQSTCRTTTVDPCTEERKRKEKRKKVRAELI